MKRISLIIASIALFYFTSCEEEVTVFDNVNGQTAVAFGGGTDYNVTVPEEGLDLEIPITITTVSDMDRTLEVSVSDASVGSSSNYSIGTITIPANEYNANLEVSFNFDQLVDGEVYELILNLNAPADGVTYNDTVTIEYFKEIVCNDFLLTVVTDTYGGETTWEIANADGEVVQSGGPYLNVSGGGTYTSEFFLEDGCYTFTIFDSYGDGQQDGTIVGNYTLECSILKVLEGGGEFESSQTLEFCVNQ